MIRRAIHAGWVERFVGRDPSYKSVPEGDFARSDSIGTNAQSQAIALDREILFAEIDVQAGRCRGQKVIVLGVGFSCGRTLWHTRRALKAELDGFLQQR
jgi:hypothetical protein